MFFLYLKDKIDSAKKKSPSKLSTKKSIVKKEINRRASERFPIDFKHLTMMNEQDIFLVREISAKGFSSIVSPRGYERLNEGDIFSARIRYLGEVFDIEARVSWKSADKNIGFELINAERRAVDFMQRLLHPINIAKSLKKVDASFMKENREGKTWYHGDQDTDLYLWHDLNGSLCAWQLIHHERFTDWHQARGLSTGELILSEESLSGVLTVTKDALKAVTHPEIDMAFKQFTIDVVMAGNFDEKEEILQYLIG